MPTLLILASLAAQASPLLPSLPPASAVFDPVVAEAGFVKLCGQVNRDCRTTQNANIDLLRKRYEAPNTKVEQRVKMLALIDEGHKSRAIDWQIVRLNYQKWLEDTGAAPRPVYPSAPSYRSTTKCTSRSTASSSTTECVSY